VQDNGQGFDASQSTKGMGLANLQARATTLAGTVEIESTPGQGTRVRIDIPLLAKTEEQRTDGQPAVRDAE